MDDGDGGAEVGTELMGEATADSNMGDPTTSLFCTSPTYPILHCIALHAEGVRSQVIMQWRGVHMIA